MCRHNVGKGEGEYLDSLVSLLKIEEANRPDSIKKIKSLSEIYTIIPASKPGTRLFRLNKWNKAILPYTMDIIHVINSDLVTTKSRIDILNIINKHHERISVGDHNYIHECVNCPNISLDKCNETNILKVISKNKVRYVFCRIKKTKLSFRFFYYLLASSPF